MSRNNYHTHTLYCDGNNTPRQLVEHAISLGCEEIGFSGHSFMDVFDEEPFWMTHENTEAYKAEIRDLRDEYSSKIRVLLGVEQDYFSPEPTDGYDYVIGSVHYVEKDGYYIPVDESKDIQIKAVNKYYGGDFYSFAEDYYKLAADLYNKTKCDIIGHFDIITKYNEGNCLFDTKNPRYIAAYESALEKLSKENVIFEVNYGSVSSGRKTEPFPEKSIQDRIILCGKRLIYSSDCHEKEMLLFGIPEGNKL